MIRIITGKGGVGKSVVALAMARYHASKGRRTLLCEHTPIKSSIELLGLPPSSGSVRSVGGNLWAVRLQAEDAMREYALMILRFRALYNAVFENRMVKYFLRAVPSLGEFVTLGKVWFEETAREGGRPRWDEIIVDAPATGHVISWLRVPQTFEAMLPPGPLLNSARDFRAMLEDGERCRLDVVTLPEEMPVNEVLAIDAALAAYGFCNRGLTIANRIIAHLPEGVLAAAPGHPLFERLREEEHWRQLGERYLANLPLPLVRVARQPLPIASAGALDTIGNELAQEPTSGLS